jgi:hypothetical protein
MAGARPKAYRFAAKNAFITYPNCPGYTLEAFSTLLSTLIGQEHAYRLCLEAHEDGTPHFHAVIQFATKRNIHSANWLDIEGHHPNIQSVRNMRDSLKYCTKDGQYVDVGDLQIPNEKFTWKDCVSANSVDEFMLAAKENFTRDFVLSMERLEYAAEKMYGTSVLTYTPKYTTFISPLPAPMQNWVDNELNGTKGKNLNVCTTLPNFLLVPLDRPLSLILTGDSRVGKTAWARSLGRHMYWNGMFMLDTWDEDCKYAIFDDFEDWTKFYMYKQFLGAQEEFVLTDKYRKKRNKRWGKPSIVISNEDPHFRDRRWLRANVIEYEVTNKLY